MADSAVAITAGTGTNIDTRTESVNGDHRQVVVLGDPVTGANVAQVNGEGGLEVASAQTARVTGSITAVLQTLGPWTCTGYQAAAVTARGTYAGISIAFEGTDDGTNWFQIVATKRDVINNVPSPTPTLATNAQTAFICDVSGFTQFRIRSLSFTSGTCVVGVIFSTFSTGQQVNPTLQINGIAPLTGNGVTGTGSQRVTVASDNTAIPTNVAQMNGVPTTMGNGVAGTGVQRVAIASDNTAFSVNTTPTAPTQSFINSAATTNATSVKGSAGTVFSIVATNTNAAARYLKFYNKASAPTVGTDVPVLTITLPASQTVTVSVHQGIRFGTGIALATTTGSTDANTGAVAASEIKIATSYI